MDGRFIEPVLDCSFDFSFEGNGNNFIVNHNGWEVTFDRIVDEVGIFR